MIRLVTGTEMRKLDEEAIVKRRIPASILMDHAGKSVADVVLKRNPTHVCIVCGKGNNGGDGWVAARWLKHWGIPDVTVVTLVHPSSLMDDARQAADMAISSGIVWQMFDSEAQFPDADVYVDAILGTGVSRALTGIILRCVESLNSTGKPVVAVDVPTGIDADTGHVHGIAVKADATVAMACEKIGTAVTPGATFTGIVHIADIGIPVPQDAPYAAYITAADIRRWLPKRWDASHKGSYGKVAIGAGDMRGAAILAALGAARVGTGLVRLGVSDVASWSVGMPPELVLRHRNGGSGRDGSESGASAAGRDEGDDGASDTGRDEGDDGSWRSDCEAIVIGPGLGAHGASLGWDVDIDQHPGFGVLDADAITHLVAHGKVPGQVAGQRLAVPAGKYVLTPHPKECGVLLGCSTEQVQSNRIAAVLEAARRYQSIVLLKGYRTVIATPSGNIRVIPVGNASLATAGTGDILAGMIGGLLAQGLPPLEAACAGAYLHGRAGELAGEKYGMASVIASDVVDFISRAIIEVSTISHE